MYCKFWLICDKVYKKLPLPKKFTEQTKLTNYHAERVPPGLSWKDLVIVGIHINGGTSKRAQLSILHCHIAGRVDAPSGNIVPHIKNEQFQAISFTKGWTRIWMSCCLASDAMKEKGGLFFTCTMGEEMKAR